MGHKNTKVQQDDSVISCGWKETKLSSFEAKYIKIMVTRLYRRIDDLSDGIRVVFSDGKGIKIYHNTPMQELLLDFPNKNSYLELYDFEQELVLKLIRVSKNHERKELIF